MPLIKSGSQKAVGKNIGAEEKAGKPKAQSLAIALSVQRKNKKSKKMAAGGKVEEEIGKGPEADANPGTPKRKADNEKPAEDEIMSQDFTKGSNPDAMDDSEDAPPKADYSGQRYADGGMIDEAAPHTGETMEDMLRRHADEIRGLSGDNDEMEVSHEVEHPHSMAEAIMQKRKMADGGMVDLEANSEESPNMEDQYSFRANGKEQYDLSQLSKQPRDSNLRGDSREDASENMDDASLVDAIRRKLRAKRGD